jgi:hypothetical protein
VIAVLAAASMVAAPSGALADEQPSAEADQAVSYRAGLPLRLEIDPVAKQLLPTALEGAWEAVDVHGQAIASMPLEVQLSGLGVEGGDAGPGRCEVHGDGDEPGLTGYGPVTASHTASDAFHLQYRFYTYQLDDARRVDNRWQRQFAECIAGGGSTFNGAHQTRNGAGSTMEDPDSALIDRFDWGTKAENAQVTATVGLGPVTPSRTGTSSTTTTPTSCTVCGRATGSSARPATTAATCTSTCGSTR